MDRIAPGDISNKFPEGLIIKMIFSIFFGGPNQKVLFWPKKNLASCAIRAICIYYIIIPKQSQLSTD